MSVAIGIQVESDPARLAATIGSLLQYTDPHHRVVLIPDGADGETTEALASLRRVMPVLEDPGPRGGAAALNRLVRTVDAGVYVLLENGVLVAPHWLEYLLRALERPGIGLAGPSTNRSWNAQGVFTHAGDSEADILRVAALAQQRFGSTAVSLAPLYSLADFCYAIKREAFDAAGGADEQYGAGPCWEMDLNIRAARAGFDGLWVGASYVWRAPVTARRQSQIDHRFTGNKHLYQSKFCGALLRGERQDYREHCRGDACPNFAPKGKPAPARKTAAPQLNRRASAPPRRLVLPPLPAEPLVSCIMPTFNRRPYVRDAIRYFLAQDYPRLELVVVDDGTDPIHDLLPDDPRFVYVRLEGKSSVGAKRNLACERARGDVIVHWDDDDWYPPSRVRIQVNALQEHGIAVCGTSTLYYFDRERGRAYRYRYTPNGRRWVGGNTLAYRRDAWKQKRFANMQVGEDSNFVWRFLPGEVIDLQDPALCVAAIHPENVSPKRPYGAFWIPEPVERVCAVMDAAVPAAAAADEHPLISCIMPTWNRRAFIPLALQRFQEQTWPNRELIIIDDGSDPIEDLVSSVPGVRYLRVKRMSIGAKRNLAAAQAHGEIIAHWDDDDWYSSTRLATQAAPIFSGDADVTALVAHHLLEAEREKFWTITPELHRSMFVCNVSGGTLVYRRAIWSDGVRYPPANIAEDAVFLRNAIARGCRLRRIEEEGSYVYVRHGKTAWRFQAGTFLRPNGWKETTAPPGFSGECFRAYVEAARQCRSTA